MAGLYADVPGYRWDLGNDGTRMMSWRNNDNGVPVEYSPAQIAAINGLDITTRYDVSLINSGWSAFFAFLFPEARDLRGLYWQNSRAGSTGVIAQTAEYSLDTTDGRNGTWAALSPTGSANTGAATPIPGYRTPGLPSVNGVRGIRLKLTENNGNSGQTASLHLVHMYGFRSQTVDRLAFWHPTSDVMLPAAHFDFSDVARGSVTGTKTFRIKNLSATKTATGLQVSAGALSGSSFGAGSGLQVSSDGTAWSALTPAITLAPGAISSVMSARISLDALATPMSRSGKLATVVGGWA